MFDFVIACIGIFFIIIIAALIFQFLGYSFIGLLYSATLIKKKSKATRSNINGKETLKAIGYIVFSILMLFLYAILKDTYKF